jgi:hypothetical protein
MKNSNFRHQETHDKNAKNLQKPGGLFFNILPFTHPKESIDVSFTAERKNEWQRFSTKILPPELTGNYSANKCPEFFYTRFSPDDDGIKITVNLKEHPAVARAYYTGQVRDIIAPQVEFIQYNFLKDTQFWCSDKTFRNNHYHKYYRFTVRVQHNYADGTPELLISYDGTSHLVTTGMTELVDEHNLDTRQIKTVAFRKRIYPFIHLSEDAKYHPEEVFPVLNRDMAKHMGWNFPFEKVTDGYSRAHKMIAGFTQKYIMTDEFRAVIPHTGYWKSVPEETTGRLNQTGQLLEFGEGGKSNNPREGITQYGPLKFPEGTHFRYFFIYFEENRAQTENLYLHIIKKKGFTRLSKFTQLQLQYAKDKNIVLSLRNDYEQQVREAIGKLEPEPGIRYFAFYVSPWTKFEPDEKKHRLYYRIKEMLLYRQISMQTVEGSKLESDFGLAIANIGMSLIAKMGGVPWRLENREDKRELVVGFGAYRRRDLVKPYVGSAVCFSQDGTFREFDVFRAGDTLSIAGSAVEAFQEFRKNYPDAQRLVIHFYKRMGKEELAPLEKMLEELELDIPVVVAGIRQNHSKSLLVFDGDKMNIMPQNGTWTRCGDYTYLLNVNHRKKISDQSVKQSMPLKVEFQCNREGYLDTEGLVSELLTQIYTFGFMHWRSVRQSPTPVTVKYPALIASFMPWFKQKTLSPYGRSVPWFL